MRGRLYTLFLVLTGIVLGTFVGSICKGVPILSWLAFGVSFGLESPIVLNLGVMSLTFGISINLTLAVVIFIILSLAIGRILSK